MAAIPDVSTIFWLFMLFIFFYPQYAYWSLNRTRRRLMKQIAAKRHSQVITLIHRQEKLALLGIPIFKFIDMDDSEEILRIIRSTPQNRPIDLIIHSAGAGVIDLGMCGVLFGDAASQGGKPHAGDDDKKKT